MLYRGFRMSVITMCKKIYSQSIKNWQSKQRNRNQFLKLNGNSKSRSYNIFKNWNGVSLWGDGGKNPLERDLSGMMVIFYILKRFGVTWL